MTIREYTQIDADSLFALIQREGEEWEAYWKGDGRKKYENALSNCLTYLILEDDELCGYVRVRDDDGFGTYVMDLLVDKKHRGKEYGRLLMERVCHEYPDNEVYVLGDVYPYYEKLGYKEEGKVYNVKIKG